MSSKPKIGSTAWWQAITEHGTPVIACQRGTCQVTFYWRDPAGDETTSRVQQVWLYIIGVTDHHQRVTPQSLQRVAGTDVWQWTISLRAHWRGSYCFIPSVNASDFPPAARVQPPDYQALCDGWRQLLPMAIADPLNPAASWQSGLGHPVSPLHLPLAPPQPGWQCTDTVDYTPPIMLNWQSQRLGNQRRIWLFTTGDPQSEIRPLALLLDGQFWAENMPVWPALQAETNAGHLPPAVYLLIDVIDMPHRQRELPCNAAFWLAVQEELLPLLKQHTTWRDDPATTVVAGQSFGGLSALYAVLHWPHQFGCALSQSGSFWWPQRDNAASSGWLVQQIAQGLGKTAPVRIVLQAGLREPLIHQAHQQIYPLLHRDHPGLIYHQIDGGHDALCWRGGLTEGLSELWTE